MNAKKAKLVRRKGRELAEQISSPSQMAEHIGGGHKNGQRVEWRGERRNYKRLKAASKRGE